MSDEDDTITEHDTKKLLEDAIEGLGDKTYLYYIDRDSELSDKQCSVLVGGQKDQLMDTMDWLDDEYGLDAELESALPDEEEREALKEDDEAMDRFREICRDRDASEPIKELIENTGRKPVRFYIRDGFNRIALEEDSWNWSKHRIEVEARRLCKFAGLDWALNHEAMTELVTEASGGGVLCVYAYVEMSDVSDWTEHCLKGDERGRVCLTFKDPHLLVHDNWNGSGHDVKVKGEIKIRFGRGALDDTHGIMALDARNVGTGYSWEETCGPYLPAYECDPEVELYRARRKQAPDQHAPEEWPGR